MTAAAAVPFSERGTSRNIKSLQPLDDLDVDEEESWSFSRQVSPASCRLVECNTPSPTCADPPDDTRLEFEEFRKQAAALSKEFFCSQDIDGMIASVASLCCRAFHDELASILLRASLDQKEDQRQTVVPLFIALCEKGQLTPSELSRGFEKLVLSWSDLQLDVPGAPGLLVSFLSNRVGLLDKALFARLPEDLLTRVNSELPEQQGAAQRMIQSHLMELSAFKVELGAAVENFFCTRSAEGLAAWLKAQCKPAFHHEVVLRACLSSFSGTPSLGGYWTSCFDAEGLREEKCRLVLDMLVEFHSPGGCQLLLETDVQMGFSRLLGALAEEMPARDRAELSAHIVRFLAGALEKELLPAQFLKLARRLRYGGIWGVEAVKQTQRLTPLYSRRVWGAGDARHMRAEIQDTIAEYFDCRSSEEMAKVIAELHLSSKEQANFLRKFFVAGMERGEQVTTIEVVQELMGYCWSELEVQEAFQQLRDIESDLVLDFPKCRQCTDRLIALAVQRGLLKPSYMIQDAASVV